MLGYVGGGGGKTARDAAAVAVSGARQSRGEGEPSEMRCNGRRFRVGRCGGGGL